MPTRTSPMADRPIRVQRKRTKGWRMPPNTVYVGAPSRWSNPWRVGGVFHEGVIGGDPWRFTAITNAYYAVECYRKALSQPDRAELVQAITEELRGKNLACWCPLNQSCHADVLLEMANPTASRRKP